MVNHTSNRKSQIVSGWFGLSFTSSKMFRKFLMCLIWLGCLAHFALHVSSRMQLALYVSIALPLLQVFGEKIPIAPLRSTGSFQDAKAGFCNIRKATSTASLCAKTGEAYALGSAADLLGSARLKSFSLDTPQAALSTNPNVLGVIADYTMELSQMNSRIDIR
jgi:hypothetical protein